MSRPPGAEGGATWKGLVIIAGAALVGVGISYKFPARAALATSGQQTQGTSKPAKTTTTLAPPPSSSTTLPLRSPKDVRVLVANATTAVGAAKKVVDALKPACYAVQQPVEALPKVKATAPKTSVVYASSGFEREAALITTQLQLLTTANAGAVPPELPVPNTKASPAKFDVLVLVGQDLVDHPPEPLPACAGSTASSTTSTTTKAGTGRTTTTVRRTTSTTTAKSSSTTAKSTSTTAKTTTTT